MRQAEQLLYTATAQIASIEREIAQTENALSLLLGRRRAMSRAARRSWTLQRAAAGAGGPAVVAARAAAGHPPGGADAGRGERADRRRQGGVLSAHQPDWLPRRRKPRADRPAHGAGAELECRRGSCGADLQRRPHARATCGWRSRSQRELVVNYQHTIYRALREVSDALDRIPADRRAARAAGAAGAALRDIDAAVDRPL